MPCADSRRSPALAAGALTAETQAVSSRVACVIQRCRFTALLPDVSRHVLQRDLRAVDVAARVDRDAFRHELLVGLRTAARDHRPHHAVLRAADANAAAEPRIQL